MKQLANNVNTGLRIKDFDVVGAVIELHIAQEKHPMHTTHGVADEVYPNLAFAFLGRVVNVCAVVRTLHIYVHWSCSSQPYIHGTCIPSP